MTKDEWIWVSIRIFGIFLLILAIMAIPRAISTAYSAYVYLDQPVPAPDSKNDVEASLMYKMLRAQISEAIRSILEVLIYGFCGLYFVRGGKIIHNLVSRE